MRQKKALLFFVPIRRPLTHPLTHRKRAFTPPRQEWVILEDEATTKTDAGESAIALVDRYVTGSASLARAKPSEGGTLMFQFESVDGGTVFNPDALRLMKEIDDIIMDVPGYEDFCQLAYDGTADDANSLGCVPRVSPTLHFFPSTTTFANGTVVSVPDGGGELVSDVDAVVRRFADDRRTYGYFLDGDFDATTLVNRMTRLKYPMGAPLPGYADADDDEDAQEGEIGLGWLDEVEVRLARRFGMRAAFLSSPYMGIPTEANTEIRWYAGYLRSKDSSSVIQYDLSWAGASILAVWVYMSFHTGSVFVGTLGMFEILMSFPVSIFIYRVLFRVSYLGNIQILSVFVVLGVGADDVFVFFDAFKQSAFEPTSISGTLLGRVTYTARRASKAISVTSFTTMMAFMATAMSKVMPISAFGILSATMIFVLFVVNVLFFPPALVLYERHLSRWCTVACRAKTREKDHASEANVASSNPDADAEAAVARLEMDVEKLRPVEKFYRGPFFRAVAAPYVKHAVVASFIALMAVGASMAAKLQTPAKQEQWYPDDHVMQAFSNNRQRFMSSDEDRVVMVDLFWGLRDMDIGGVDRWNPRERGKLILDGAFDASSEAAQTHLRDVCDAVKNATCDAEGCVGGGLVRNGADGVVVCPMEAFEAYLAANGRAFPTPADAFLDELWRFVSSDAGRDLRKHVGFERAPADGSSPRLFYHRVSVESTLIFPTTAKVSRPVFDRWNRWLSTVNANAPEGVNAATQTAYFTWTWMKTQEALVENTVQGLVLCFVMAFAVLLVSTMDLVVGLLSTVCIAGIVTTVMGVGVHGIMGWSLGIGESIAAVILIGLSVDYCVHLANAYVEAPEHLDTREKRTQHALMIMGISITASAVTTIISGSMLWMCILSFFGKFAFLITATIVSSFVWSMFFLPSALASVGPASKESWSSLWPAARWVSAKMRGGK